MFIHYVSYKNIGPLVGEKRIDFKKQNTLIDSPIGTGKSFTYFDGVMYGLFKRSRRDIININSKEGYIEINFTTDHNYTVKRYLTKKIKTTSCQTVILKGDTEIPFKNEIDQQRFLDTVLPDREVFMNTSFLMQDSQNIFDVGATDRLNLLRDIFGLSNIEKYKEIMKDKKKEAKIISNMYKDTSDIEEKILELNNVLTSKNEDIFGESKESIEKKIVTLKTRIEVINSKRSEVKEKKQRIIEQQDRISKGNSSIAELEYKLAHFNFAERDRLKRELQLCENNLSKIDIKEIDKVIEKHKAIIQENKIIDIKVDGVEKDMEREKKQIESMELMIDEFKDKNKELSKSDELFICDRGEGECKGTKKANDVYNKALQLRIENNEEQIKDLKEKIVKSKGEEEYGEEILKLVMSKQSEGDINKEEKSKSLHYELQTKESDIRNDLKKYDDDAINDIKVNIEKYKIGVTSIKREIDNIQKEIEKHNDEDTIVLEVEVTRLENDRKKIEDIDKIKQEIHIKREELKDKSAKYIEAKGKEDVFKILYEIFSKELLMFVLSYSLPTIEEIINSLLENIVSYKIMFELKESKNGKTSFGILISDDRGVRDISSLSGGQRVVLRIVWMLAINNYMKSQLLFLDETINNLDSDTIGKVAESLEGFISKNNLCFICVTHDKSIKALSIRDETKSVN